MSENKEVSGWVLILWGLLAVLFGLAAVTMPAKTDIWLLYLIAIFVLIDAVLLLFQLLSGKIYGVMKWALWLRVVLGLILGAAVVFFKPLLGSLILGLALIQLMGLQSIIIGVLGAIYGLQYIKKRGWWPVIFSVIWVIFGVILLTSPLASLISLTRISGVVFLALGVTNVMAGLKGKSA